MEFSLLAHSLSFFIFLESEIKQSIQLEWYIQSVQL